MSYTNLSELILIPAEKYVDQQLAFSDQASFFQNQILARGANLLLVPTSLITCALDTIVGIGAGIGTILTVGKHLPTCQFACNHIKQSFQLLPHVYASLLRAIHPQASLGDTKLKGVVGFVDPIWEKANTYSLSDHFLKRHVASRLTFALALVASVVTRAVDGIFGICFAALSLLTLGKIEKMNEVAYNTLKASGVIRDLFFSTLLILNPWAFQKKA